MLRFNARWFLFTSFPARMRSHLYKSRSFSHHSLIIFRRTHCDFLYLLPNVCCRVLKLSARVCLYFGANLCLMETIQRREHSRTSQGEAGLQPSRSSDQYFLLGGGQMLKFGQNPIWENSFINFENKKLVLKLSKFEHFSANSEVDGHFLFHFDISVL